MGVDDDDDDDHHVFTLNTGSQLGWPSVSFIWLKKGRGVTLMIEHGTPIIGVIMQSNLEHFLPASPLAFFV
jgi:hypothetical protein